MNGIPYFSRNFNDARAALVNYVKQYYPEIFNDFNDASVGMMLLELNAAIGDMLSFNTDRMFQETQINYAQERSSVLSMARTFGLKIPYKRPSITLVDFSVVVPVLGDTFDIAYAPIIRQGAQVSGAGKVFETTEDIDFSSPFMSGGIPNRTIIPNIDANGNIINYTLTKREIVLNGVSKVYKRVMTENDVKPFLQITLPDTDVLSINSIITLNGTNYTTSPNIDQFLDMDNRWFEVDALAEDKIFIKDELASATLNNTSVGRWVTIDRRFVTEFTDNGFLNIIFGGGSQNVGSLCDFDVDETIVNRIGDFINNMALGSTVQPNTTLFVSYRVGGGITSNIGPNTITSVNLADMVINGPSQQINTIVRQSLQVNNPIPAIGGKNEPSVEEIRNLVRYNFSAQNRAVTIKDYQSRIAMMPGTFGVPFRYGVLENQNKISVYILTVNASGELDNQSNYTLKSNISEYLSEYRMINDYVEVKDGKIINLAFDCSVLIDKQFPQTQIMSQVINTIYDYMDINKYDMGQSIYLSGLIEAINNVSGVLNVVSLDIYNKVGDGYSLNEISQPYLDDETRLINYYDNYALIGSPISMFEIKNKSTDIKVRVKAN